MRAAVKRLQERQANGDKGFSILELVIWIVVAGILMGAAIVGYNSYKHSANVNNLKSVTRDVSTAAEATFSESGVYPTSDGAGTLVGWDAETAAQITAWTGTIIVSATGGELSVIATSDDLAASAHADFTGSTGKVIYTP